MNFIRWILFTLVASSTALAKCGDGMPPKHSLIITWNGQNDREEFDKGVEQVAEKWAPVSDVHYYLQGRKLVDPKVNPASSAFKMPQPDSSNVILDANKQNFQKTAEMIQKQVEKWKTESKQWDPEDVEVVFFMTNHGHEKLKGNVKDYGIAIDDRFAPPGSNPNLFSDATLWSDSIREFGKKMPRNIRFKTVIGLCFGTNVQETLLSSLDTPHRCKCGVATAPDGFPANIVKTKTGHDASLSAIVSRLAQGTSLTEGAYYSRLATYLHKDGDRITDNLRVNNVEENDDQPTSFREVMRSLNNQFKFGIHGRTLNGFIKSIELYNQQGFDDRLDSVAISEGDKKLLEQFHDRNTKIIQATANPADSPDSKKAKEEFATELRQQEIMLRLFFHGASREEKQRWSELLACENDPVFNVAQTNSGPGGGPKPQSKSEVHK